MGVSVYSSRQPGPAGIPDPAAALIPCAAGLFCPSLAPLAEALRSIRSGEDAYFFLGPYRHGRSAALLLSEILAQISDRLSQEHGAEPRRGTGSAALAQAHPLL